MAASAELGLHAYPGSSGGEAARAYVAARLRNAAVLTLVGLVLFFGGFTGFGVYGSRSDSLAAHGVHATAVVVGTALYGGRYGGNQFDEHINVAFSTPEGIERARLWIGEQDRFAVGQDVAIVYDPKNPSHAQLAHGADLGPIGFPFFFAIVLGVCFAPVGVSRLRVCLSARRALRTEPHRCQVATQVVPRGRTRRRVVFVGDVRPLLTFWSLTRSGWIDRNDGLSAEAAVFGELRPGAVLVVVAEDGRGVAVGRTWRNRRRLRFGRR